MIVPGMNALTRRSCTLIPVRTFAAAAKSGGSGNRKPHWNGRPKQGNKKPQTGTKPELKSAPAPVVKTSSSKNSHNHKRKLEPKPAVAKPAAPKPAAVVTKPVATKPVAEPVDETPNAPLNHIPLPSPNPPLSAYTLPPSKLRALIDLYHSSTNYITPETLSDEIDKTFAPLRLVNTSMRGMSYQDLVAQRDELDAEPDRVVPSTNELGGSGYGTIDTLGGELASSSGAWSASKGERARMVKAALWGVDPMAKIGLETLLEAKVELEAQEKEHDQKK